MRTGYFSGYNGDISAQPGTQERKSQGVFLRKMRTFVSLTLCVSILMGLLADLSPVIAVEAEESDSEEIVAATEDGSYEEYLNLYGDRLLSEDRTVAAEFSQEGDGAEWYGLTEEGSPVILLGSGDPYVEYVVDVPESGLYNLEVVYEQTTSTTRAIAVSVQINGESPFSEAEEISVPRIWEDSGDIRTDSVGNEVAPTQIQVTEPQTHVLLNTSGYYDGVYNFYLEAGENVIRITGNGTEVYLMGLNLIGVTGTATYQEYLAETSGSVTSGYYIKVQGENASLKSDSVLYPNYDRVTAATEDSTGGLNDPAYIRINTIGGSLWNTAGQWISWEIEVPEDGYYNLGCKFKQNYLDGLFTSRAVYIDGELLFDELSAVRFNYSDEWQTMTFSDSNGEPYLIYLTAGTHEIKMMCTMGDFADTLRSVSDCIYEVNQLYRQIIMITSTSPDSYTDYFLTDRIPNLVETMEECRDLLEAEIDRIVSLTGEHSSKTATLETLKVQLDDFIEDTTDIPSRLSSFKDNISAVGSWLVTIQSQGLLIDYIYLKSPDVEEPEATTGFVQNVVYAVKRFLASFNNTDSVGGTGDEEGTVTITVWLSSSSTTSTGRDQAQIIKDLIDESFTPETGIVVDLQLVSGSLVEATLAGLGPDVALMLAEDQPVNLAIRGALQDLTEFEDYEEVLGRFYDSSVEPFWYEDGLYALPDTQVFNMLFYRTDVFEELGIEAPETWEEFYEILPVIQRNNLQITVQDIFPALLLQNGGSYYSEDGTRSLLDSQIAIDAMTTYTDLYVEYGFDVKTDFYSRFRSGELVMSIQPYNMYNYLMVAAPEINGLWEMVPIPGVEEEDGTINRSQNSTVTGTVMLADCENKEAAWEFMKWWSSDSVKASYAIALEGMMGASARFTPANINTMSLLPWSDDELSLLTSAWESVIGIPQLPGSYYTSRGLTNAFRSIVYNGDTPRAAMKLQTKYINEEITRKREEFGLTTAD